MRNVNKPVAFLLVITLFIIILTACQKDKQGVQTEVDTQVIVSPTKEVVKTESNNATVDASENHETASDVTKKSQSSNTADEDSNKDDEFQSPTKPMEMRDISSIDLVKEIKIGWNLGNTMDATDGTGIGSEISWGNPITKKEMIDTVKTAGFNTLRIPTTWEPHLGPAPDYAIDKLWLKRVQTIVNYGMANNMYVIINLHHEEWYNPFYDNADSAMDILAKVWKQIADYFENYDEHLIFEGLNEPRQKGTSNEWNGGDAEGWDVVNQLNEVFVQTIRNSGGNNPLRHLMIPPYAATASTNAWGSFIVPNDDKLIVSIHAYTPYNFALNKSGTKEWSADSKNDTAEIDNLMNNIYNNFINKGTPVILGEFGAMEKNNTESRTAWAEFYVKKAAEKGIPCIWWDNGAFDGDGELFGLLDRKSLTWKSPEVVDALMKGIK